MSAFLNASQVLTVNGILKSGNNASAISGGAIQAATNGELVIRADQAGDGLTINSPILANGTSGLTKAGQGTVTLAASDNYTGVTIAAAGSLVLANSAALQMSTFDTSGAGLLNFGGFTAISFGGLQGSGNLTLANSASSPLTLTVAPITRTPPCRAFSVAAAVLPDRRRRHNAHREQYIRRQHLDQLRYAAAWQRRRQRNDDQRKLFSCKRNQALPELCHRGHARLG